MGGSRVITASGFGEGDGGTRVVFGWDEGEGGTRVASGF